MNKAKSCMVCSKVLGWSEFYDHPRTKDGKMALCKHCHKERMRLNRINNPAVRAYDRKRSRTPERKKHLAANTKNFRARYPEKYAAQAKIAYRIKTGALIRQPCERCGSHQNVHAHHDDYSKPLDIIWLCPLHHAERHKELRVINND